MVRVVGVFVMTHLNVMGPLPPLPMVRTSCPAVMTISTLLFYGDTFVSGVKFAASLTCAVRDFADGSGERKDTISSASVRPPGGFRFTVTLGSFDNTAFGTSDPIYRHVKLAYEGNWVPWGRIGVGTDYFDGSDFSSTESGTKLRDIAAVQRTDDRIHTDVNLKHRNHDFDGKTKPRRTLTPCTRATGQIVRRQNCPARCFARPQSYGDYHNAGYRDAE